MTNLKGIHCKKKHHAKYPDVSSAIKPVPHDPYLPVPEPNVIMESSSNPKSGDAADTAEFGINKAEDDQPMPLTQSELNDLTRDLNLSEEFGQLLGSRLQDKHLLVVPGTTFYWYRDSEKELIKFCSFDEASLLV